MSDAPERIWIEARHLPDTLALDRLDVEPDADEADRFVAYARAARITALEAEVARLRGSLGQCVKLLDDLRKESGRGVEWGEEDAFRMGEWFEDEENAIIDSARALAQGEQP